MCSVIMLINGHLIYYSIDFEYRNNDASHDAQIEMNTMVVDNFYGVRFDITIHKSVHRSQNAYIDAIMFMISATQNSMIRNVIC